MRPVDIHYVAYGVGVLNRWQGSVLVAGISLAAGASAEGRAQYFRYYDASHQVHLEASLSEEAINQGYDELDAGLHVIRKVPARLVGKALERALELERQQAEAEERTKQDVVLHQLYATPQDAERERDRQVDAIQVHIDYNRNSLSRLRFLRAQDAARAAGFERRGDPVPKDIQESIKGYDRQIISSEADLRSLTQQQQSIRDAFAPKIQRLEELQSARTTLPANEPPSP